MNGETVRHAVTLESKLIVKNVACFGYKEQKKLFS